MITVSIVSLILSLLIQGVISNYISYALSNLSIFYTIYTLINLIVILPYFNNNKKYYIILAVFALLTDIAYTNTFGLHLFIFTIVYIFNKFFFSIVPYNLFTTIISSIISITIYHIISFIILFIVKYDSYNIYMLATAITHSIIMTIITSTIMYTVINFIYKKFELKEVR